MEEKIRQLEKLTRPLEPDAAQRSALRDKIIRYTEAFLEDLPDRPAFVMTEDKGAGILDSPLSEEPLETDQVLELLKHNVDRPGVNLGTRGYLAAM